ncbi:MAG: glycoside hydrolase family 127 protein [Kiritimatiellae bacterium]|nr:glycoside hydrolase family 127 protein [Kiritimatiellia bacterium]
MKREVLVWTLACIAGMQFFCTAGNAADETVRACAFRELPLGSVKPQGWLKKNLELQRDGLTGHAEELYEDIGQSDWVSGQKRGGQFAWERGPYYARGLIALAYVLDDPELKKKAVRWIDPVLASQRENGDFGPLDRNWWANMIVLYYLRDYYEATGDKRIVPFLQRYFRFQLTALPKHPLIRDSKWAKARGGDNLDVVLWLYDHTHENWLLDLARLLREQTAEWSKFFADGTGDQSYSEHIVNANQGLKSPALFYRLTGDTLDRDGFANALRPDGWIMRRFGRVDGMFNGSEPLSDRETTGGTESCAIAERIWSSMTAIRVLGDATLGDQLETVAYNAIPTMMPPDCTGVRYYSLLNQLRCTNQRLGFCNNGDKVSSICPSPHSGYGCCRSNFHFAWPKFVQSMWMATPDNGLVAIAYGANTVEAKVGSANSHVVIEQSTLYPFDKFVGLTVKELSAPIAFPLRLRIPAWCAKPLVKVNGETVPSVEQGRFLTLSRTWKAGDKVELLFPMEIKTSHWANDSVAVTYGPLVYSYALPAIPWKKTQEFLDGKFATWEIEPAGAWNYALLLNADGSPQVVQSGNSPVEWPKESRFTESPVPHYIRVKAFRTWKEMWGTFRSDFPARAVEPPLSPVEVNGAIEEIDLIPYACTQIRLTLFPWGRAARSGNEK